MKTFDVYSPSAVITIKADSIKRVALSNEFGREFPTRILFFWGDEAVAEFFCDRICGWAERRE